MGKVIRYEEKYDPNHSQECICHRGPMNRGLEESPEGDFVDIEDYEELKNQLAKANERVKELEQDVLEEIENRDSREEWLDKLSSEISRYFCVDIGEHSSANNPWLEAFEAIPEGTLNKFTIEQQIEAINEALDYYEELKASEEPIGAGSILHVCLGRLVSHQEQLRKEQGSE